MVQSSIDEIHKGHAQLCVKMCSKGGATASALAVFDAQHFKSNNRSYEACLSRSEMETLF